MPTVSGISGSVSGVPVFIDPRAGPAEVAPQITVPWIKNGFSQPRGRQVENDGASVAPDLGVPLTGWLSVRGVSQRLEIKGLKFFRFSDHSLLP